MHKSPVNDSLMNCRCAYQHMPQAGQNERGKHSPRSALQTFLLLPKESISKETAACRILPVWSNGIHPHSHLENECICFDESTQRFLNGFPQAPSWPSHASDACHYTFTAWPYIMEPIYSLPFQNVTLPLFHLMTPFSCSTCSPCRTLTLSQVRIRPNTEIQHATQRESFACHLRIYSSVLISFFLFPKATLQFCVS